MNKKLMYAVLAVLLVLVILVLSLILFGKKGPREDFGNDAVSSFDNTTDESAGKTSSDFEEEPILGDNEDLINSDVNNTNSSEGSKPSSQNESSKPVESKPSVDKPTQSKPTDSSNGSSEPDEDSSTLDAAEYEKFLNMTPAEQQKHVESFSSMDAFFDWYNAVKDAYIKENPPIDIGDGEINFGDIVGDED